MWRNYLTVGIRALAKNKTYAAINILGLAIGMAACLLILLFVRDQYSYDRFYPDAERIYQLQATNTDTETGEQEKLQMAPLAAVRAFTKDFPQVETVTYVTNSQPIILDKGDPRQLTITLGDRDFFKIFDIPFLHGDKARALADPSAIAISAKTATMLFGTENAIGRSITTLRRDDQVEYRVSAVFKDLPKNSHQQFGMVRLFTEQDVQPSQDRSWGWFSGYGYFKLRQGADAEAINAQLKAWAERVAPRDVIGGRAVSQAAQSQFKLVPIGNVYFSGAGASPSGKQGDETTVLTFAMLAVLVLVMACVNFVNLATARASQRAREVSLRKVLGATRSQLVTQFLGETVLVAGVAMVLALAMVELALPWLRSFLDAGLPYSYFGSDGIFLPALLLVLLVGVAGGVYPALYLTRFKPAEVLKANKSAADAQGSGRLRNALVVGQFAISIGLIACTLIVYSQVQHARSIDPGFRYDGLLQVSNASRARVVPYAKTLEQEFARIEGVKNVARTTIGVSTQNRSNQIVLLPGRAEPLTLGAYSVGYNFFETMGMKVLAGRTLSESQALDDASLPLEPNTPLEQALVQRGTNVVVNESSARQMGFRTPQEAIGKPIRMSLVNPENGMVPATIVGVVADTRYRSVHEGVEDIIYYHNGEYLQYFELRFDSSDPLALRDKVEAVWKRVVPQVPFEADFADEVAAGLYEREVAMGQIFAGFAVLAVIVGCLGLFGLASFTAERRTKEIGIRKVLGARSSDIVKLLTWDFSKPVLVANLIAWPVAWWAMREWLNGFDTRIALSPLPFLLAGGLALIIALVTIGGHAAKVARSNPIKALRYE